MTPPADNDLPLPRTDQRVRLLMVDLIVQQGLSYADAIKECDRKAEEASAPYRTVAALLRAERA